MESSPLRHSIQEHSLPNIVQVRYFNNSSIYLCLSIGVLEVFARMKDLYQETQTRALVAMTFNFLQSLKEPNSNLFYFVINKIINSSLSSFESLSLLKFLQENQGFCESLPEFFREFLYDKIDSEKGYLKEAISSGKNMDKYFDCIFPIVSNTFNINIILISDDIYTYKPGKATSSPKLIVIYRKGDYSLGYNEEMKNYDESNQRDSKTLSGILISRA